MGPGKKQHQAKFWTEGTFSFHFKQSKICIGGFFLAIKMIRVYQLFLNIHLIQEVVEVHLT